MGGVNLTDTKTTVLLKNDLIFGDFVEEKIGVYKRCDLQIVCNKLYKREALEGLYFLKTGAEDVEFNCKVFLRSEKAIYINAEMYDWVQRESSITHQPINANFIDKANSYMLCLSYIPENETYYRALCLERIYKVIVNVRYHAANTKYEQLAQQTVSSIKKKTIGEFIRNKQIPPVKKIGLLIFVFLPAIYSGFMWLCEKRAQINRWRSR